MAKIEIPQDKRTSVAKFTQDLAQETKKTFTDSLHVFRRAAELGVEAASAIATKLRPYAAPIAGTTVTGAAGVAAVQAFGLSGVLEAGAYTGLAAGAVAGGSIATVAAVGVTVKVLGWLKEGAQALSGAAHEKIKDLKAWLKGAGEFKKAFFAVTKERAIERCEKGITTDEVNTATKAISRLHQIQDRYKDDSELSAVIKHVSRKATELFGKAHAKHESELARLKNSGISVSDAKKQIVRHTHALADKLTSDIFSAYNARLDKDENPYAGMKADLNALEAFATDFSIQNTRRKQPINYSRTDTEKEVLSAEPSAPEAKPALTPPSAETEPTSPATAEPDGLIPEDQIRFLDETAASATPKAQPEESDGIKYVDSQPTSAAHVEELSKIFGDTKIKDELSTQLLNKEATPAELAALLTNDLSGTHVSYDPESTTALSKAIKAASIPAHRDIPHYHDLALELRDTFPDHVKIKGTGGAIVITVGEQIITLTNRHPSLGGKVNIAYNGEVQGGMWNDKVKDVVEYFIKNGEPPKLKNQPIRDRVIAKTVSSAEKAVTIYDKLRAKHDWSVTIKGPFIEIANAENTIYVKRDTKDDPRKWNVYSEKNGEAINKAPISIDDIQAEIEQRLAARRTQINVQEAAAESAPVQDQSNSKSTRKQLPELPDVETLKGYQSKQLRTSALTLGINLDKSEISNALEASGVLSDEFNRIRAGLLSLYCEVTNTQLDAPAAFNYETYKKLGGGEFFRETLTSDENWERTVEILRNSKSYISSLARVGSNVQGEGSITNEAASPLAQSTDIASDTERASNTEIEGALSWWASISSPSFWNRGPWTHTLQDGSTLKVHHDPKADRPWEVTLWTPDGLDPSLKRTVTERNAVASSVSIVVRQHLRSQNT